MADARGADPGGYDGSSGQRLARRLADLRWVLLGLAVLLGLLGLAGLIRPGGAVLAFAAMTAMGRSASSRAVTMKVRSAPPGATTRTV